MNKLYRDVFQYGMKAGNYFLGYRTTSGKQIFSIFLTSRSCGILMRRSDFVVRSFMIGGWMIGTSAM